MPDMRSPIIAIVGFIKKNYYPFFMDVMIRYLPRISIVLVKLKTYPKPVKRMLIVKLNRINFAISNRILNVNYKSL